MRLFFILMLAPLAAVAIDLTDQQRADIEARIQPFSAVCVQGETVAGAVMPWLPVPAAQERTFTMRRAWHAIQPVLQGRPRWVTRSPGRAESARAWTRCTTVALTASSARA